MGKLAELRNEYHRNLLQNILGYRADDKGRATPFVSIDDGETTNRVSTAVLKTLVESTGCKPCLFKKGTSGSKFETITKDFLENASEQLRDIKPGKWVFTLKGPLSAVEHFEQFEHLKQLRDHLNKFEQFVDQFEDLTQLKEAFENNVELRSLLEEYRIQPDITISREPVPDELLNASVLLLHPDEHLALQTPLRAKNQNKRILHASVSCKWTLRSDRSQSPRSEALTLIRNRKGSTPRFVIVTFDPMPTRIGSIAMGTGDIDCTYHGALYELEAAVEEFGTAHQKKALRTLTTGRRLRDISDLPFDLAI